MIITIVLQIGIGLYCKGQGNNIQVELLGQSFAASVGYEHQINRDKDFRSYWRLGFIASHFRRYDFGTTFELGRTYGKKANHMDASIGLHISTIGRARAIYGEIDPDSGTGIMTLLIARIGYRYQKPDGRFVYRLGFTPILARHVPWQYQSGFGIHPWAGMSFGYVIGRKSKE